MSTAILRDDLASFHGKLIGPGDDAYEQARRPWNALFNRYPAVIAQCADREDVVAAVACARRRDLAIAVRGGGHSHAGHSTCAGGMVIDLGGMTRVEVDPGRQLAVVSPGATWTELTAAAQQHGLAPVGGHVPSVGVTGLTLGGGIGWLSRAHGLACDNLIEAELVTAAGTIEHASAEENPELLWGLRGGGGNFGIVTELVVRLHPIGQLLSGMLLYPGERAIEVLRLARDVQDAAGAAANVAACLLTAPPEPFVPESMRGLPAVLLAACYVGPVEEGNRALAPLREQVQPAVDMMQPMPFGQLQHLFDATVPPSLPLIMKSELLGALDDGAFDALVEHAAAAPSPVSNVMLIPLGGAAGEVAPDATAFWNRHARYNLEIGAAMNSPDEDPAPYEAWAAACWHALRPYTAGVQVNHLADEGGARVRQAYGANYPRLAALKAAYDPDNVFRLNQNVEPARA